MDNYFVTLNSINVNDHTEKKNGLTYLAWAYAWAEIKKNFPDATYTVYENADGWNYHTDGRTAWVKTGVTVNGLEHIEYLPVMDMRNRSIPLESVTSFDVNKAIQRSLTKACARHGLGLYIYAGEDLPEGTDEAEAEKARDSVRAKEVKAIDPSYNTEAKATPAHVALLSQYYTGDNLTKLLKANHIEKLEDLPALKAGELLSKLAQKEAKK